ncbi:MAG: hypothetical protein QNJ36_09585 [Calothrix sp. MO_167.B42]|nr:hypothetical protein [Calothrix sp. MO_167.B42]
MKQKNSFSIDTPSPLWVISLFVSLTEVVTGIAVIQASGAVQIALTVFVIVFPLLIATMFFLTLWYKPYVFYPPKEFGKDTTVIQYVEAMQRRQEQSIKSQRIVMTGIREAINDAFSSPEILNSFSDFINNRDKTINLLNSAAQIVQKDIKKSLNEKFISIDTREMLGNRGELRIMPYEPLQDVGEFLDSIWFDIRQMGYALPPYTYGEMWALKDANTGKVFLNLGRDSNSKGGSLDKYKPISESEIEPGMSLIVIFQ